MKLPEGYTARPLSFDDVDLIARLIDDWDLAYYGEVDGASHEGVRYEWSASWVDLERDGRAIEARDGSPAAYALHYEPGSAAWFELDSFVHPGHEGHGLGAAIIGWAEDKTRTEAGPGTSPALRATTGSANERSLGFLSQRGFTHIRTFFQMWTELPGGGDPGTVPDAVTIRRSTIDDARGMHAVLEEGFAEHFGHVPETFDEWWAHQLADPTFDPTMGIVAEAGGEQVGAAVNGVIAGTGWVFELAVRPPWRRRGIARSMLRHAFAVFADAGATVARLGVDTENATGALDLYRSVGMEPVREWCIFEKHLEAG